MSTSTEMRHLIARTIIGNTITGITYCQRPCSHVTESCSQNIVSVLLQMNTGFSFDFIGFVHGSDLDYLSHTLRVFNGDEIANEVFLDNGASNIEGRAIHFDNVVDQSTQDLTSLEPCINRQIIDVVIERFQATVVLEGGWYICFAHGYPGTTIQGYQNDGDITRYLFSHDICQKN